MEAFELNKILKLEIDGQEIEYELCMPKSEDERLALMEDGIAETDELLAENDERLGELNAEIDRLTNKADAVDYALAVASGVICGVVDSLWVGEFSFEDFGDDKLWADDKVNSFVMNMAKKSGYDETAYKGANPMKGAIRHLEDKYHIPSDGVWNSGHYGINAKSHHIDDWAHHPSLLGLLFSILTQFTKNGYFQNKYGENSIIPAKICIETSKNGKTETIMLIGNDIRSKIYCGIINWFMHIVSDMAGSGKTPGKGVGIPGPLMTMLKEFSSIPGVNKTQFPKIVGEFFEKNNFDFRSELAIAHGLGKQAIPVIINECIVRSFYFIRRLAQEIKEKRSFEGIEWKKTLPFKNRTIVRMMTIASATFTAVDLADAAIRSAAKSGGNPNAFAANLLLRVNFVGLGRCVVAVVTDIGMGIKKSKLENERMMVHAERLQLLNAKIFYRQCAAWIAAETTQKTLEEAEQTMTQCIVFFRESIEEIDDNFEKIGTHIDDIRENDPELIDEMLDML